MLSVKNASRQIVDQSFPPELTGQHRKTAEKQIENRAVKDYTISGF